MRAAAPSTSEPVRIAGPLDGGPFDPQVTPKMEAKMTTQTMTTPLSGLPDPDTAPEFYEDVSFKRAIAWIIDVIIIGAITALVAVFTLFMAVLLLPLFMMISFVYRWVGMANHSATPGQRLMSIEFRRADGERLDAATAFLHVSGYFVSVAVFPLQLISIAMMMITSRKQGLTDMILGTAPLNRR